MALSNLPGKVISAKGLGSILNRILTCQVPSKADLIRFMNEKKKDPIDLLGAGEILLDMLPADSSGDHPNELRYTAHPGGSAFNTIVMAARLGMKTAVASKIGNDPNGRFLLEFCGREGIETGALKMRDDLFTTLALAERNPATGDCHYRFLRSENASLRMKKSDIPARLLDRARLFHFSSMYAYEEKTHRTIAKILEHSLERNLFTSFDPNIRPARLIDPARIRNRILRKLPYIDLLKLSQEDMHFLVGTDSPSEGLAMLERFTRGRVVLTLGREGSGFLHDEHFLHVPAFKVEVEDTIGAGDAFMAGLLFCRARSADREEFYESLPDVLEFASAVAAIACTGQGALAGLQDIEQVAAFLDFYDHRTDSARKNATA